MKLNTSQKRASAPESLFPLLALSALFCGGCATINGPAALAIKHDPEIDLIHVEELIDIPEPPCCFYSSGPPPANPSRRYRETLMPRDSITILVTDTDPKSPFYSTGAPYRFGPVEIPRSGRIKVPYLGEIDVEGMTMSTLSYEVTEKVKTISSSVDATVLREKRLDLQAGVIGAVNKPGSFPINREGFNSLHLLAVAGGGKDNPDNYVYKLQRNGKCYCYDFCSFSTRPFLVEEGDVISVEEDPGYAFHTMGLFKKPGRNYLRGPNTSLADAIYDSGGFDSKGDPKGVFVFRDPSYCQDGNKCDKGKKADEKACAVEGNPSCRRCLPAKFQVYVIDLSSPDYPFLAQKFKISERDVIYASESPVSQMVDVARDLGPVVSTAFIVSRLGKN